MVYNDCCVDIATRVRRCGYADFTALLAAFVATPRAIWYRDSSGWRKLDCRDRFAAARLELDDPPAQIARSTTRVARSLAASSPLCFAAMTQPATQRRYEVVDLASLPPVECPCGFARRGLTELGDVPITIHETTISADAATHYHQRLTEAYYILECDESAHMELDGQTVPLAPGRLVLIRPGIRHRAVGRMKVLVIVSPKFDPADEWFD